ncbi:3279_t:CDS:1, partial [Racocetra fulgida]
ALPLQNPEEIDDVIALQSSFSLQGINQSEDSLNSYEDDEQ